MEQRSVAETQRQLIHFAALVFALLFRYFSWHIAALLAFAAFLFNVFGLPRFKIGKKVKRPNEPFFSGVNAYPLAVLVLVLICRDRFLYIAAGAWAVLAAGDSFSNIFGRMFGGRKLSWNTDKSIAGLVAFILTAAPTAFLVMWWVGQNKLPVLDYAILAVAGTLVAAFIETINIGVDDNFTVALSAVAVMDLLASLELWQQGAGRHDFLKSVGIGIGVNLVLALLALLAGLVSFSGVIGGFCVGTLIYIFTDWKGFLILAVFFAIGSAVTKLGYRTKAALGAAQEDRGRRGAKHAIANCFVGVATGFLYFIFTPRHGITDQTLLSEALTTQAVFMIGFVAAFATALADTVASEIGQLLGKEPVLITTFKKVPPGTEGAVSVAGTIAGVIAALLIACIAWYLELLGMVGGMVVIVAGILGMLFESVLGALFKFTSSLSNEMMNFLNTIIGALLGIGIAHLCVSLGIKIAFGS